MPKTSADLKKPTISVVIPNHNDSKYLRTCLASILQQRVHPDQIIFVDDASTDDSLDIAKEMLTEETNVKIIANRTCLGTMGALNKGLQSATGDYVLFLASNDYLVDGIFEKAKSCIAMADVPPGIWSAMVWVVDELENHLYMYPSPVVALQDTYFTPEKCIRLASLLGGWFMGTTIAYHRETLQKIGGFDTYYQGLADLLAALTVVSLKGASFSPAPFGIMRLHSGGYLFRTLTNLINLETIFTKISARGAALCPALYNSKFCNKTKHRFRFAAIKTFNDDQWIDFIGNWQGLRYRLLNVVKPVFYYNKKIGLLLTFFLLRPFDVIPMIWYRFLLVIFVCIRLKTKNK